MRSRVQVRFRNRRGAIAVMVALMFFGLLACAAIAIDFSRIATIKEQLQTAADAGALAGALQLVGTRDTTVITDSATAYATRNRVFTGTPALDSVVKGNWDAPTRTFVALGGPSNAVRVRVSLQPTNLIMTSLGATVPRLHAAAVAWANAPVSATGCMKPLAIPYEVLMFRLNNARGLPNSTTADLTRPFDPVNDLAALRGMSVNQRTFTLKHSGGPVTQTAATSTNMPGNYQAVRLGKYWDFLTQTAANPAPVPGANAYRDALGGTGPCYTLSPGDSLQTQPGAMAGPTIQGIEPAVCQTLVNTPANLTTHGQCLDGNGTVITPEVKAAFFTCGTGCSGQSVLEVKLLGAFALERVYPSNAGTFDRAEVVGVLTPTQGMGPVGGAGLVTKLVLAQ